MRLLALKNQLGACQAEGSGRSRVSGLILGSMVEAGPWEGG